MELEEVYFDRGGFLFHGKVKALAEAAREEQRVVTIRVADAKKEADDARAEQQKEVNKLQAVQDKLQRDLASAKKVRITLEQRRQLAILEETRANEATKVTGQSKIWRTGGPTGAKNSRTTQAQRLKAVEFAKRQVLAKKPYVWGSIYRFDGQASVFWAEYGPCYRCLYPEPPPPGMVPSCAEGGVLGVLCATIGSIQTTEAIKVLTGVGEPLIGSLMVYDALEMTFRKIKVRKDPNCPLCSDKATQTALLPDYEAFCGTLSDAAQEASTGSTITVQELKSKIDNKENFYLIDVREPSEYEIVNIPTAHLIPKQGFIDGSVLASLPQDKPIVLHCKSGVRSAECLAILKNAGFADASHVFGGVIAWAKQIDTTLPVY